MIGTGCYQPRNRTFDPLGKWGRSERKTRVLGRGEVILLHSRMLRVVTCFKVYIMREPVRIGVVLELVDRRELKWSFK